MKKNNKEKTTSITAKVLAGTLAALLFFGSVALALSFISANAFFKKYIKIYKLASSKKLYCDIRWKFSVTIHRFSIGTSIGHISFDWILPKKQIKHLNKQLKFLFNISKKTKIRFKFVYTILRHFYF